MIPRPRGSTLFPYTTLFRSSPVISSSSCLSRSPSTKGSKAASSTFGSGSACATSPDKRRSEEHTSELQSLRHLVCRLLLEKKNRTTPSFMLSHHYLQVLHPC